MMIMRMISARTTLSNCAGNSQCYLTCQGPCASFTKTITSNTDAGCNSGADRNCLSCIHLQLSFCASYCMQCNSTEAQGLAPSSIVHHALKAFCFYAFSGRVRALWNAARAMTWACAAAVSLLAPVALLHRHLQAKPDELLTHLKLGSKLCEEWRIYCKTIGKVLGAVRCC